MALLDPSIDVAIEYSQSLSSLLDEALKDTFPLEEHANARDIISNFLATAGRYPDRAAYISQLGNGAFNYFSLTATSDIAEQLKKKLSPLLLFLDTNFLFAILGLHTNPFVDASNELLRVTEKYKLPFKLRYHQATYRELSSTINRQIDALRARQWTQAVSRAASASPYLSGIELKYHELNAKNRTDVNSFLRVYEHIDILLKGKNIDIYNVQADRLSERSLVMNEYREFLEAKGRSQEKTYEIIDHDATVLDTVRQLRSNAKSSLDAGALLVTCDSLLYRFDWETSRAKGGMASVVLPHLFLQILRPFVNSDTDFDRSFAETFAIPEFRTMGNGAASRACSRMLSYFALYKPFPEETAKSLLSNSLLIDRLRTVEDDQQFKECIESAIAAENTTLLEDKIALEKQLRQEQKEKEAKEKESERERVELAMEKTKIKRAMLEQQKELAILKRRNLELAEKSSQAESVKMSSIQEQEQTRVAIKRQEQQLKEAQRQIDLELEERKRAERIASTYSIVVAFMLSLFVVVGFEFLVHWFQWQWLLQNSNSYGLQLAIDILLSLVIFGIFCPNWRKWCWSGGGFALFLVILQILGGPNK